MLFLSSSPPPNQEGRKGVVADSDNKRSVKFDRLRQRGMNSDNNKRRSMSSNNTYLRVTTLHLKRLTTESKNAWPFLCLSLEIEQRHANTSSCRKYLFGLNDRPQPGLGVVSAQRSRTQHRCLPSRFLRLFLPSSFFGSHFSRGLGGTGPRHDQKKTTRLASTKHREKDGITNDAPPTLLSTALDSRQSSKNTTTSDRAKSGDPQTLRSGPHSTDILTSTLGHCNIDAARRPRSEVRKAAQAAGRRLKACRGPRSKMVGRPMGRSRLLYQARLSVTFVFRCSHLV